MHFSFDSKIEKKTLFFNDFINCILNAQRLNRFLNMERKPFKCFKHCSLVWNFVQSKNSSFFKWQRFFTYIVIMAVFPKANQLLWIVEIDKIDALAWTLQSNWKVIVVSNFAISSLFSDKTQWWQKQQDLRKKNLVKILFSSIKTQRAMIKLPHNNECFQSVL